MHVCAQGGKVIHILHSYLCSLDFWMEPPFDCVDEDLGGGVVFIKATIFYRGSRCHGGVLGEWDVSAVCQHQLQEGS
jgi:hypothetical protein